MIFYLIQNHPLDLKNDYTKLEFEVKNNPRLNQYKQPVDI